MEDKDGDAGSAPSLRAINQLLSDDNVDLNTQLAMSMPNTAIFDDFDLGVDVLDSELRSSEPIKSPMVQVPSSPYQLVATSPATVAIADMQLMSLNDRNEYLSQEHSASPSSSSVHSHQSIIPGDDLSVLLAEDVTCVSNYNTQFTQASPVNVNGYHPFSCASSYPNTTYTHTQQCTVSSSIYNPTLTSVNLSLLSDPVHLMDLTEASKLVSSESGAMMLDTCYGGNPTSVPVMTSTSTTIANSSRHPYIENSIPQVSSNNIMVTQTEGIDTCSRGSQTPGACTNSGTHDLRRSLSPAPNQSQPNYPPVSPSYSTTSSGACYYPNLPSPHSPASSYASLSPGPAEAQLVLSPEKQRIVDMPFHQFKNYLDDTSIPEKEKEDMKNVRRRGKNKVAAKNCRKKKLSVLCGLQQEVDLLKSALSRHSQKSRSLEQEISFYKARCTRTHGPIALSRKHS